MKHHTALLIIDVQAGMFPETHPVYSSLPINNTDVIEEFGLEKGREHLTKCFKNVILIDFESNLKVAEVEPLVEINRDGVW
jgi:hypothetical protein